MEDPTYAKPIVESLIQQCGMKQSEIVRELKARGFEVTQPTISRIKAGARTSFQLGMGLLKLHQSRRRSLNRSAVIS